MSDELDVIVVGGGPVGLASAIEARKHGLSVVVLERQRGEVDKACGEGLMPSAVRWLEVNRVLGKLSSAECRRFTGIRYVSESGTVADGRLPDEGGLGVRRLALSRALRERAREVGVDIREGVTARDVARTAEGVTVRLGRDLVRDNGRSLDAEPAPADLRDNGRTSDVRNDGQDEVLRARVLIGADGLHSSIRADAGLEVDARTGTRFGMRRHFAVRPWSRFVEVHFAEGVEAYVTPVGDENVGIAFLWSKQGAERATYDDFLARFPGLEERVRGAESTSTVRGAGPLLQRVSRPVADRLVLIGDAAGYVDAITGEGLTLGFHCAELLGAVLPGAIQRGAIASSFEAYERGFRMLFDRYAFLTETLLSVSKRPTLRNGILKVLAIAPGLFDAALAEAMPRQSA